MAHSGGAEMSIMVDGLKGVHPFDPSTIRGEDMKTARRKAAKSPAVTDASTPRRKAAATKRANLALLEEAYTRLMVHCIMSGEQPGLLVSGWIMEKCTRWNLPGERKIADQIKTDDRPDSSDDVSETMAAPSDN
jgi:hypothetical protein